jgi:hypothetical protein
MALKKASDENSLWRRDLGPWFTARHTSDCNGDSSQCLITIEEGDQVRYRDGVVVCEECGDENAQEETETVEVICSGCHEECE